MVKPTENPRLPDITQLQFAVLSILILGEISGRQLRKRLRERFSIERSGPAFYQIMARLEDAKMVRGRYQEKEIDGYPIKERTYKITASGIKAWQAARDFSAACGEEGKLGLAR